MTPPRFLARALLLAVALASAASLRAQVNPVDRVVQLPPLIVEESRKKEAQPWRYAEGTGFEILSRSSDSATTDFARGFNRINWLVHALVPDSLLVRMSAPQVLLLYGSEQARQLPPEIVKEIRRTSPRASSGDEPAPGPRRIDVLPNLTLRDNDFLATYSIITERLFDGDSMRLTADNFRQQLEQRTPPLPIWFIDSIVALYASARLDSRDLTLRPLRWVTEEETRALRGDPEHARSLLPLAELFRERTPLEAAAPDTLAQPWHAQGQLFLRWAFDAKKKTRRDALWRFVARCSEEPVSEELFQQCFGLDYADAQERLSDFLPEAVKKSLTLTPPAALPRLKLALRNATPAEVARLKGDWERLSVSYVRNEYPALVTNYIEQARLTLLHAYDHGERDPRLLGVIGLSYAEIGQTKEALPFLETAAQAEVVRPRVYFELARLRYIEAAQHSPPPDDRFTDAQLEQILQPLRTARTQSPPTASSYDLLARVLLRGRRPPTPEELAWIAEGPRLHPRSVLLLFQAAALHASYGATPEALAFIDHGLALVTDTPTRKAFEQLRALAARRGG